MGPSRYLKVEGIPGFTDEGEWRIVLHQWVGASLAVFLFCTCKVSLGRLSCLSNPLVETDQFVLIDKHYKAAKKSMYPVPLVQIFSLKWLYMSMSTFGICLLNSYCTRIKCAIFSITIFSELVFPEANQSM